MPRRLLVPLDGTDVSRRALPLAATLARAGDGAVLLLAVVPDPALERSAADELARLAETLSPGATALPVVLGRDAAAVIASTADAQQADLLVMATHRWSAVDRWLNGSVAEQVLHRSHVPVLLIGPEADSPSFTEPPLRVLVPLDGSDLAERALGAVGDLAAGIAVELQLVRVVGSPSEEPAAGAYLEQVAGRLRTDDRAVRTSVVVGQPAEAIARTADAQQAHVIALSTHGRSGFDRLRFGSVTMALLPSSMRPLLVIPPE